MYLDIVQVQRAFGWRERGASRRYAPFLVRLAERLGRDGRRVNRPNVCLRVEQGKGARRMNRREDLTVRVSGMGCDERTRNSTSRLLPHAAE
jgi:hypothetical protein